MDIQAIIVGIIVLLSVVYAGKMILSKVESFSRKSSCGADCGCGVKDKVG